MSCGTNANLVGKIVCRMGISRTAGLAAAYQALQPASKAMASSRRPVLAGALAVAGLAATIAVVRSRSRPPALPNEPSPAIDPRTLPDTPPRPAIQPSSPPPEQTCPACNAGSDKPGPWYAINGRHHCADCAPEAARKAGFRLTLPAPREIKAEGKTGVEETVTTEGAVTTTRRRIPARDATPRRTDEVWLTQQPLDVHIFQGDGTPGIVRLDENAFAVMRGNEETGLGVARDPAKNGGWSVVHVDTGMALAGDMDNVYEAEGLAQLLAPINWNQPFDEMPRAELKTAGKIIGKYQTQMVAIKDRLGPWTQW